MLEYWYIERGLLSGPRWWIQLPWFPAGAPHWGNQLAICWMDKIWNYCEKEMYHIFYCSLEFWTVQGVICMVFKSVYHCHWNIALMVKDSRKTLSPNRGSGRRLNTGKYTNTKSVAGFLFTSSNKWRRFSFECRKVTGLILWNRLYYTIGLKKRTPLFHPIRSKTKPKRDWFARVFPRFSSATCNYYEFWFGHCTLCILCDWFYDTQMNARKRPKSSQLVVTGLTTAVTAANVIVYITGSPRNQLSRIFFTF